MLVNRLHTKLFEAAAWDLDRKFRAQFVGESLRAPYLKDFGGRLSAMTHAIDMGVEPNGRFLRLKLALKRLLRPYTTHQGNVDRMIIDRLSELHSNVSKLAEALQESKLDQQDELSRQTEAIRAELRRAAQRLSIASVEELSPIGVTAGRAARSIAPGAKLMLGKIPVRKAGYLHIDPTIGSDSDISAPLDDLPVEPGTAAEIVIANILELYTAADVRERLLPYWASLLQPGGRLTVIADDAGAATDRFRDGQVDFTELTAFFFGDGDSLRRSAYTPELLREIVAEAGLTDVTVNDRRQNADLGAYGFELAATRRVA